MVYCPVLSFSLQYGMAWHIFRLWMEETASRYMEGSYKYIE